MPNKLPSTESKNIMLAIFFALSGALCNAIMSVFVKTIGHDINTVSIIFFRFFIGLLVLLPWLLTEKNLFSNQYIGKLFLRSVTTLAAMYCFFYAVQSLPVTNALLLNNTFPLFMPFLVLVLFNIKTSLKMWVAALIGFFGVSLVLQFHMDAFNIADIVALTSGFLAALSILQIRLLSEAVSTKRILFYMFLFCTLLLAIILPFYIKMPTPHQMLLLFAVGVFGAGYQLFLSLALEYAIARIVSPIFFTTILFGALMDWFIWGYIPNTIAMIGMILVIVCGITITLLPKK